MVPVIPGQDHSLLEIQADRASVAPLGVLQQAVNGAARQHPSEAQDQVGDFPGNLRDFPGNSHGHFPGGHRT